MRFRVLRGKHREGGQTYGKDTPGGMVFDHEIKDKKTDMVLRDKEKFQRVDDDRETGRMQKDTLQDREEKLRQEQEFEDATPQPLPKPLPNGLKEEVPDKDVDFDGMTVAELRKMAEEEEINLGNASRKEDIVRIMKNAYGVA